MRCAAIPTLVLITASLQGCSCNNDNVIADSTNVAPTVLINAPETDSIFAETESLDFLGTVADGNGLNDIQTTVWASDLQGELGTPEPDSQGLVRLSTTLNPGTHTVTLTATDVEGAEGADSVVVSIQPSAQAPTVVINQPQELAQFVHGDPIDLFGTVSDPQQDPNTLDIMWTWEPSAGGAGTEIPANLPDASGATTTTWTDAEIGDWRIVLTATDTDANLASDDVVINVIDPGQLDNDNDGYVEANDCDDNDPSVHPYAPELCNGIDDDCNGIVDDKDDDGDNHVDENCVLYDGLGANDDCDDSDPTT